MIKLILAIVVFIILMGCRGPGSSTPISYPTSFTSTSTDTSTSTSTGTGTSTSTSTTTSTSGGNQCPSNLAFSVSPPAGNIIVNVPATFTITATGCYGVYKQSQPVVSGFFSSTITFNMTFTQSGSQTFSTVVDAYDLAQANILQSKTVSTTVNVQGGNPPPGAPTCSIARNGSVADTNALLPVIMTGQPGNGTTIVSATINDVPVTLGNTYQLGVVAPNTGAYSAIGKVVDALNQIGYCSFSLQAPTVDPLQVISVAYNSVTLRATIHGPISDMDIDGFHPTLPTPPANTVNYTFVPAFTGPKVSSSHVINGATNDKGSNVSPSYCVPHQAIAATGDTWSPSYLASSGYSTSPSSNELIAGRKFVSFSSGWTNQELKRNFNQQIKTTDIGSPYSHQCPAGRAVVGTAPGNYQYYCAALATASGAQVVLTNAWNSGRKLFNEGTSVSCPAGQVLTGDLVELISGSYYITLYCATPVWQECQ